MVQLSGVAAPALCHRDSRPADASPCQRSLRDVIGLAGLPATVSPEETLSITLLPNPISAPAPTCTPFITLEPLPATRLMAGEIGDCELELDGPIATVPFHAGGGPGAFVLADPLTRAPVGIGIVRFGLRRAANLRWQETSIDAGARAAALGQAPCVLWLTGPDRRSSLQRGGVELAEKGYWQSPPDLGGSVRPRRR